MSVSCPSTLSVWIFFDVKPYHSISVSFKVIYKLCCLLYWVLTSAWEHIDVNIWYSTF
jgi:hypothetical protein